MINLTQDSKFSEEFLKYFLRGGFGTMTKREIEILVFHLISSSEEIVGKSNYEISNILRITESKVKTLKLEASLKYGSVEHEQVLRTILKRLINQLNTFIENQEFIVIELDDPIEKREFEYAIKQQRDFCDYSFNRDILKIRVNTLIALMLALGHEQSDFQKFLPNQGSGISFTKAINYLQSANIIINSIHNFDGIRQFICDFGHSLNLY